MSIKAQKESTYFLNYTVHLPITYVVNISNTYICGKLVFELYQNKKVHLNQCNLKVPKKYPSRKEIEI